MRLPTPYLLPLLLCTFLAGCAEDPSLVKQADELLQIESEKQRECIRLRTETQLLEERLKNSKLADFEAMISTARKKHDAAKSTREALKNEVAATGELLQEGTPP